MISSYYSRSCRTASIRSGRAGGLAGELGFCNGPGIVKGNLSTRESSVPPGSCFCPGSARWPPPDGVCCAAEARKEFIMS